jgi:hypothetical protein
VRSLLGVPLLFEGAALGVLHVGTVTPREFTNATRRCCSSPRPAGARRSTARGLFEALDREHRSAVRCSAACCPTASPTSSASTPRRATSRPATRSAATGTTSSICRRPDRPRHRRRRRPRAAGGGAHGPAARGLRAYALDGHSPGETLKRLDRLLQTISGRGMATAAYAIIDPATGS